MSKTLQTIFNDDLVVTLDELRSDTNLVKQIEIRLKDLMLLPETGVDGIYTLETEKALTRFCELAFLNNMTTKRFGRSFAKKLIEMPGPMVSSASTAVGAITLSLTGSVGENGANAASDVLAVKNRLADLGFKVRRNSGVDNDTIHAIKLFQSIIQGFTVINADGRIDVGGPSHQILESAQTPRWQEMPNGSSDQGFLNFDHVQLDNHDFGTHWLIDTIKGAGAFYRDTHLASHPKAALLTTNNLSVPRGGQSPFHVSHQTGLSCDILLPREDGTSGGIVISDSVYDRSAMRAMLQALRSQTHKVAQILLNDFTLRTEGLCVLAPGHDNHAHIDILPPT
jgi:hypothetical protein